MSSSSVSVHFLEPFREYYDSLPDNDTRTFLNYAIIKTGWCNFEVFTDILSITPDASHRYLFARDYAGETDYISSLRCTDSSVIRLKQALETLPVTKLVPFVMHWFVYNCVLETVADMDACHENDSLDLAIELGLGGAFVAKRR